MRILLIALSGAGDVLMATPLVREVRIAYPKARIECLVMQGAITHDILKNNPDINKVIYFNFVKEGYAKSLLFCKKLRAEKYDLSITVYPQARYQHSLVSWLIGAKKRIGFSYDTQKLKLNRLFFNKVTNEEFSSHVVKNNLRVLQAMGLKPKIKKPSLILPLSSQNYKFADNFFAKNKIKKAISIHAGSGTTRNFILKRWLKENFAKLSQELAKKGYKIIILGGSDEQSLKKYIITASKLKEGKEIFNLNTNILDTAAVMKKCKYIISNDTVMGHIAAAVGTNVISLFGPTSPQNTAPFGDRVCIICKRPSSVAPYKHGSKGITNLQASFMNQISVKEVISKIR